ncbi:MAG: glycosyltransferase family 4 protein [Kofleriaceae bacterium]
MKVGIYLPDMSPTSGGAFTFVETVLGNLAANASDTLVVFHYGSSAELAAKYAGTKVSFHSLAATRAGRLAKKAFFGQVTARLQMPVFHAANVLGRAAPHIPASPLDRAAHRLGIDLVWFPTPMYEHVDVPYVITVWDLEHRLQPYFPELGTRAEFTRREQLFGDALRRAAYVVTGTNVGRDEIVRFYNVEPSRIRMLPHPTPSFALDAAGTTPPVPVPVRTPFVMYPAQFWAHKNHVGLLRGVAELAGRGVTVDCALVGSDTGNQAYVRERAVELGIADRVHILGFVSRDDLVALYRNALALVYTSQCGPENLPPLEAMALGCPVIASDIAGSREQLGDAAVLVDTLDASALADSIHRVMTQSAHRDELVRRGHVRASRYTQREFGRDLGAILDEFRRRHDLWR